MRLLIATYSLEILSIPPISNRDDRAITVVAIGGYMILCDAFINHIHPIHNILRVDILLPLTNLFPSDSLHLAYLQNIKWQLNNIISILV
jgi:hypothetical protein